MNAELLLSSPCSSSVMQPTPVSSLLTVAEVAAILAVSVRTVWRLNSGGQLPEAVSIGSSKRWRRDEIFAWIKTGCPVRNKWKFGDGCGCK